MDIRTLFFERHARIHSRTVDPDSSAHEEDSMLAGLREEEIRGSPNATLNPIAWLLWHMARTEDVAVNTVLRDVPEVLDREPWLDRLGIPSRHIGTGASRSEVEMISRTVDLAMLRAYRAAVGRETRRWVADLDFTTLDDPVSPAAAHRAAMLGDFSPAGTWVEQHWVDGGWSRAGFLSFLAVEHHWLHVGEVWVVRNLVGNNSNRTLATF